MNPPPEQSRLDSVDERLIAGRYRIRRLLGRGGMGAVWAAQDEILGREVAIKEVIPAAGLSGEQQDMVRERTMREARAAARVDHPAAVTVFDVVEDGHHPWIVMQLLTPRTLADVLAKGQTLTPLTAAGIGVDLVGALQAAHRAGVLHRDVKPANVMLSESGRAVLTDFGIASVDDDPTLTASGMLVGSPGYMSPERARGERPTPASDLWSLGATLYAAVEGRSPFRREGQLLTLNAVITEPAPPARHGGPLRPVIAALLARDPAERPSAAEVEAVLTAIRDPSGQPAPDDDPASPGSSDLEADATFMAWREAATEPAAPLRAHGRTPSAAAKPLPSPSPVSSSPEASSPVPTTPAQHPPAHPPAAPQAAPPAAPLPTAATPASDLQASPGPFTAPVEPQARPAPTIAETTPAPARSAPIAGTTAAAGRPHPGPSPSHRSRLLFAAASAAILVLALALWLAPSRHDRATSSSAGAKVGAQHTAAAATAAPATSSPSPSATPAHSASSAATSAPATVRATSTSRSTSAPSDTPPGFRIWRDPSGFSVAVLAGWTRSTKSSSVYFREPNGRSYLQIDQTTHPKADALRDWQNQESSAAQRFAHYHRIRLQKVEYRGWNAADWEFTWRPAGGTLHVLSRNIRVNSSRAYALYWSVPASSWQERQHDLSTIEDTFTPAK